MLKYRNEDMCPAKVPSVQSPETMIHDWMGQHTLISFLLPTPRRTCNLEDPLWAYPEPVCLLRAVCAPRQGHQVETKVTSECQTLI